MATIIHIDPSDEIADLVAAVKNAPQNEVALVLPAKARALQTPLNLRLLAQFSKTAGKTTSIVSSDPLIQEMARRGGFATFATVAALERGVEAVRPQHSQSLVNRALPEPDVSAAAAGAASVGTAGTAVVPARAGAEPVPTQLSSAWTQTGGTPNKPLPPSRSGIGSGRPRDRRPLYFAGVAVAVIGLLLFLFVAPSATVTIVITAAPITVNPIIQGSTDAASAKQGDHILTQVVSDQEQAAFTATPTGNKVLPATAATTNIVIRATNQACPNGCQMTFGAGTEFDSADGSKKFVSIADVKNLLVSQPDNSKQPPDRYGAYSAPVAVEAMTAGASSGTTANSLTTWVNNPCVAKVLTCSADPNQPQPDIAVTNPQPATGGADGKKVVVASAQDVTNWQAQVSQLTAQLNGKINDALSQKSNGKVPAKDPTGGGGSIACAPAPALPSAGDQIAATPVTVTCAVTASLYSLDDVKTALLSDAGAQVPQGNQLVADRCQFSAPQVTQASADGTVIISAKASCFSRPGIDLTAIKSQLAGKGPSDAKRSIQGRIPGVSSVIVSQRPLPLPFLPFFPSRITVVEQDVTSPPGQ